MTVRATRARPIQVGDAVGYSKEFLSCKRLLKHAGQHSVDAALAVGRVTGLHAVSDALLLAEIEWDRPDMPARVNVKSLAAAK